MSKWIDAEWLKELYKPYESYNGKELAVPIGAILANIDDAPSIDIVRCKECKHWKESQYYPEFMVCTYVIGAIFTRQHDDFCSRGERREP